jgi:hypothetical protein
MIGEPVRVDEATMELDPEQQYVLGQRFTSPSLPEVEWEIVGFFTHALQGKPYAAVKGHRLAPRGLAT